MSDEGTATRTEGTVSTSVRHLPSAAQLRLLLHALMRAPTPVVKDVGFVLMVYVAVVEAALPDAHNWVRCNDGDRPLAVADEDRQWAINVFVSAKRWRRAAATEVTMATPGGEHGNRKESKSRRVKRKNLTGQCWPRGEWLTIKMLRSWAVRMNRRVPRLLQLMQAFRGINLYGAILLQHLSGRVSVRDADKVSDTHLTGDHPPRQFFVVHEPFLS